MPQSNNIYSVRQVNSYIKRMFEEDFILRNLAVKGEISNCKYHYSGHIYFSLKDESGVISAVMFASNAASLSFRLEDGMKVVVTGSIRVYERDGRYQLYARSVEHEGQGDLYQRFEELKRRLAESGMFDELYKKPIPRFSRRIGVVTAQTGAVIRDIYNVASRRNPYCRIVLCPSKVQGIGAAESICEGIRTLDPLGLDVIIVARGGGSMEDLWAFNEEIVARTIFEARTPVISAVGHETDFTIADFAADLRAPTPSAAAELAVFDYERFIQDLDDYRFRLDYAMNIRLTHYQDRARSYGLRMEVLSPESQLRKNQQGLKDREGLLKELMNRTLQESRERMIALSERLSGLSPLKRLSEGYAFAADPEGMALRSIRQVRVTDSVTIHVADGFLEATVSAIHNGDILNEESMKEQEIK